MIFVEVSQGIIVTPIHKVNTLHVLFLVTIGRTPIIVIVILRQAL